MEKEKLSEDEIEGVSGGGGSRWFRSNQCWFTPTGKVSDDKKRAECSATCWLGVAFCPCSDTDTCIEKWHTIGTNKNLTPLNNWNHSSKKPPKYEHKD